MVNKLNLNWPEFLEKYWQKKPVVLKNAFPDFADPITPDELAGLAMEPEVDSRLVSFIDNKWLGRFATTPRHELDIAPPEPPYQPEDVLNALNAGEKLIRLSGLRVMRIGERFFVNTEGWMTTEIKGADTLCRLTEVGVNELGEALANPGFVAELTEFINQGYWYFEE